MKTLVLVVLAYGVLSFFASLGVYYLFGAAAQFLAMPLFFFGGTFVGVLAVRASSD